MNCFTFWTTPAPKEERACSGRNERATDEEESLPLRHVQSVFWYTGRVVKQYQRHPNTICHVCKTPVYRRPIEIKRNRGRVFCSMICYGISCRKEMPCSVCGRPILSGLNKKTCSRSCANHRRTGMKYHLNRPKDKVVSQKALKMRLLKERGMACERCGLQTYQILQVHHKDRNRRNRPYKEKSWMNTGLMRGGVG
ncbi:MAG: hypothetical protein UY77_C0026G0008 [Candidatus Uhrbacteria bacterium GW2011_GWA2_53_10]|uniref:Uncharacterized protein n=1 Tax=Candidatus Uhrbacteria bacterium GW2011_GWA2_53_10 TaxID=1618980 RepID=A0A0G1XNB6_9BACT|nr:MAG: hypothetical protein UY77_C0026G0008 [Candidatus Uhrbacteria bacterium GW2011_GWA2_53_10]